MMGPTHFLIGGAAWLAGLVAVGHQPALNVAVVGWAIASVAALLPDIDSKNSLASKMLGPVTMFLSWVIRSLFGGHRKITHSIIGLVLAGFLGYSLTHYWHMPVWIDAAIMVGLASHVVADMATREGCPLLWPIHKTNYGLHLVTTGLSKKKGHHTSEYWFIRPLAVVATVVFGALLIAGL